MSVYKSKSRTYCARCNRPSAFTRKCPHEAVNRAFGEQICYYCCRECKHHTEVPLCGGIGCELWRKPDNDTNRTSTKR